MLEVREDLNKRVQEIDAYLDLIEQIDRGSSALSNRAGERYHIDVTTQQVLKASVYLHLYNLVESTVSACLREAAQAIERRGLGFGSLTSEWRRSWLRSIGQTAQAMTPENRLVKTLEACQIVSDGTPIEFEPKVPGNLDDTRIEKLAGRHGIDLSHIPQSVRQGVKQAIVNNDGVLQVVRKRRNELAHGLATFGDCGRSVTVPELVSYRSATVAYLVAVVDQFETFITADGFKA